MKDPRNTTPEEKLLHIIEKPEEVDRLRINMKNKKSVLSKLNINDRGKVRISLDPRKMDLPTANRSSSG